MIDVSFPYLSNDLIEEGFRFRLRAETDLPLLQDLYVETRWSERECFSQSWDENSWRAFLQMQFTFQHRHYSTHFPQATFMVLERRGQLMGKLYLGFTDGEIRIIDIALASAYCNRNIGKAVLQKLQQQAAACGSAVSLNVNPVNPARRFYERLGFHVVRQDETCVLMRWTAE